MSLPATFDPGPLARFEDLQKDAAAPREIFLRMTEHRTKLRAIAKDMGCPVGQFVHWFTTEHAELYDQALRVLAGDAVHEALEISDEQCMVEKQGGGQYDPDVPRDKLRVETRLKVASSWDRARYGAKDHWPVGGVQVFVDRSCGGAVAIGVKDAAGNQAAIRIGSTEPPASPAESL